MSGMIEKLRFRTKLVADGKRRKTMVELDLSYTPATELALRMRRKEISTVEIVSNAIQRIGEINPKLNCFCFTFPDEALHQARAAERTFARGGEVPPLLGIPIAIKDLTPTAGKRTTLGSRLYENWIPERNA